MERGVWRSGKITTGASMSAKNNFDTLQEVFKCVNQGEDLLRVLRDNCSTETQEAINVALGAFSVTRDKLWKVDASLGKGKGV